MVSNVEAATQGRHPRAGGQAAGHGRRARRDRRRRCGPGQLLVSLAAGITTAFIESRVPEGVAVVRVMPNTPALVDEGMAAISPGSHCDEAHLAEAESLMASVGKVLRIPERQQDAVTAISGSGPAYIFFVVESMIEAGVHLGLPRATATELVVQTLVGSAKMLARDRHPPDRAPRAGHLAGRHHRRRAARARDPQGPRGVPRRDGGRPGPLPRARRGLLTRFLTGPDRSRPVDILWMRGRTGGAALRGPRERELAELYTLVWTPGAD